MSTDFHIRLRPSLVGFVVILMGSAGTAHAGEQDEIRNFQRAPSASVAERIARQSLDQGYAAKAMNWVERMLRSPGVKPEQLAWANHVRQDLRWVLRDEGFGNLVVTVHPPDAALAVDGKEVFPRTSMHSLWLPEGSHDLAAAAADHEGAQQIVSVAREEKRTAAIVLHLSRPPVLLLKVRQQGDVWVDNVFVGESRKQRFLLTPGVHVVEVRAPTLRPWMREVSLAPGETRSYDVDLAAIADANVPRTPRASTVNRPLLPGEYARPGVLQDPGSEAKSGTPQLADFNRISAKSSLGAPNTATPETAPSKPVEYAAAAEDVPVREVASSPVELPPPVREAELTVAAAPEAPSTPMARSTKGWLLAGAGVAVAGAGAATAVYAMNAAAHVDAVMKPTDPNYATDYSAAQRLAYIGYGVSAVGGASLIVGGYYLFGNEGLTRRGKGWTLTTMGVLTGGAGAYLLTSAMSAVAAANALPAKDPDYDRQYAAGSRTATIAYGTLGGAALLAGVGIYLVATDHGSHASASEGKTSEQSVASRLQWTPWIGKGAGANLGLRW